MNDSALTFVSIATGKYLEYWFNQATSIQGSYKGQGPIKIILLTDQAPSAEQWRKLNLKIPMEIISIPSHGWPEATLLRYKLMSDISENLLEGVCIYLDADMRFVETFTEVQFTSSQSSSMTFIEHPGYWRSPDNGAYLRNPGLIARDIFRKLKFGGLGAWETRKGSLAYCERSRRKRYCCGGIWYGPKVKFLEFVNQLSVNVQTDLDNGIIAIWHDESHLNKWISENPYNLKGPSYCFASEFKHLKGIKPFVIAVQKNL